MKRLCWEEMQKYWSVHQSQWANIDYNRDPDELTNVCYHGALLWLNQYYARFQRLATTFCTKAGLRFYLRGAYQIIQKLVLSGISNILLFIVVFSSKRIN